MRSPLTSARARVVGAALAVLVAAASAGCSGGPGVAATVDGRTITQADLQDTQRDLSSVVTNADAGHVLLALVVAPVFIQAAADNGVGVSPEQAQDLVDKNAIAAGGDATRFGTGALDVVRFTVAIQNLQSLENGAEILSGLDEEVDAMDIDINPRYGRLDGSSGEVLPVVPPWIVAPTTNQ
jgi:hypothetical protein